jgi:hypothetical protein
LWKVLGRNKRTVTAKLSTPPRSVLVVTSRAAGLPGPVNSVYARLKDTEGLSPRRLDPVHAVFGASEREAHWAHEVLAAFAAGDGAATRTTSGDFVDLPVAEQARRILGSPAERRHGHSSNRPHRGNLSRSRMS